MPAPPTTTGQVQAYRFALRRMQSALVRRDAVPGQDPLQTQARATVVGVVLAVLVAAGFAVWGLLDRPADWRTAGIVVEAGSGAQYVVMHDPDRLVPVPNLASARLVLASLASTGAARGDGTPVEVPAADLDAVPRTPPVGILDAPPLPAPGTPAPAVWSVCDTGSPEPGAASPWVRPSLATTVVAGATTPGRPLARGEGLLLRDRFSGTWLVHDGLRSRVDVTDAAVVTALGLAGQIPRQVTTSVLNTIPEGAPIVRPVLPARGAPGPADLAGEPVGGVVRLVGPGTPDRWHVVEVGGVQEVPEVVARLVRLSDPDPRRAAAPVPTVSPNQLAPIPAVRALAVASYPDPVPTPVAMADAPTTCVSSTGGAPAPVLTVLAGPPPGADRATPLSRADLSGDRVDSVAVPGGGVVVRSVPPGRPDAPGTLAVVSGSGTVHGVPDPDTAAALGLDPVVGPAPEAVLGLLPTGPSLTIRAATAALPAG